MTVFYLWLEHELSLDVLDRSEYGEVHEASCERFIISIMLKYDDLNEH